MPAAKKTAPAAKAAPGKAVAVPAKAKTPAPAATKGVTVTAEDLDDDLASELFNESGAGLENATAADYALPFVYLLQKMSPQVDPDSPKFVDGAKPGMFINSVTHELFEALRVIPVEFDKKYIEWVPRDAGGGFVAQYTTRRDAEANCTEGNQIVDTANHYVLLQSEDESWSPAIISLTSTKLKASRNWVSKMGMVTIPGPNGTRKTAPTYARMYDILKEGPVQNEKGTYFIVKVEHVEDGWVKDAGLREQAKSFAASIASGQKGADFSKAGDTVDAEIVEEEGEPTY